MVTSLHIDVHQLRESDFQSYMRSWSIIPVDKFKMTGLIQQLKGGTLTSVLSTSSLYDQLGIACCALQLDIYFLYVQAGPNLKLIA